MHAGTSLLVDHYHKTYEISLLVWEQRNRTFLFLLAVVGAATLLTLNVTEAQPILVDLVAKLLSVDTTRKQELRTSLPYGLVQTILLMTIAYFTLILYHRTTFIGRTYAYLEPLELEIGASLGMPAPSIAFTREGKFYQTRRPILGKAVWACFAGMLGILLGTFLVARIFNDFKSGSFWFGIIDLALAAPTLVFFAAYAFESSHDSVLRRIITKKSGNSP